MNALPIVSIGGFLWFIDYRLNEVRRTDNFNEKLTIDEARMLMALEKVN